MDRKLRKELRVPNSDAQKRWMEQMPVLAGIARTAAPEHGEFVRKTDFGSLYLDGDKYTLVTD